VVRVGHRGAASTRPTETVDASGCTEEEVPHADRAAIRPPAVALGAVDLDPPVPECVADSRVDPLQGDVRQHARHRWTPKGAERVTKTAGPCVTAWRAPLEVHGAQSRPGHRGTTQRTASCNHDDGAERGDAHEGHRGYACKPSLPRRAIAFLRHCRIAFRWRDFGAVDEHRPSLSLPLLRFL